MKLSDLELKGINKILQLTKFFNRTRNTQILTPKTNVFEQPAPKSIFSFERIKSYNIDSEIENVPTPEQKNNLS